jgi:two-component system cell cycle response regulator
MRDSDTTRRPSRDIGKEFASYRAKHACLVVIHGPSLGKKFDLDKDQTVIGRAEDADVSIEGEFVSRLHAVIVRRQDGFVIEDKDSTNGTLVNTRKVTRETLHDQDLILIGDVILKFISSVNIESAYHEEMHKLATMDHLLQVYNKTHFIERLRAELARNLRYRRGLSLLMLDVDHFKRVNDNFGHPMGDFVLQRLASIIKGELRTVDVVGRYGGEEFAVLLPETGIEHAAGVAEKLREQIEKAQLCWHDHEVMVTLSVGLTAVEPGDHWSGAYTDLIERADRALYQAKQGGRNRVAIDHQQ